MSYKVSQYQGFITRQNSDTWMYFSIMHRGRRSLGIRCNYVGLDVTM